MTTMRPRGQVQYDNTGRIVIVTGGANGIGRAVTLAFQDTGATVVVADMDDSAAETLTAGVEFFRTDVSQPSACRTVVDWVVEQHGAVDILVNNAAIQPLESYAPIDQLNETVYERMVQVNLSGYTYMAKYALFQMKRQQSGVVVNVASGQGHRTARQVPVYGPLKAANLLQAMQWGVEYARNGIRVVSVSPGAIDTALVRASLAAQGGRDQLANRHPMGRIGRADEVASAILWLASDGASLVTATDLAVDGGLNAFGAFADPFEWETAP